MTREERIGWLVVGTGVAFGALGAVASFEAVNETMQPSFGAKAWMVPVGVDLGIAAATAGDLWMASRDERTWWLRYIPTAFTLGTVYLNVVGERSLEGRVAHALLVFLWIAFAHAVAHVVKLHAVGRRQKIERLDRIRTSRWVLAPLSSTRLWRWMVLNEQPSYTAALVTRGDRRLARAELRDRSGSRLWWRSLSHRDRELYRQGRLAQLDAVGPAPQVHDVPAIPPPVVRLGPASSNGDGITVLAEQLAEDMASRGQRVTRRTLQQAVKAANHGAGIGTTKADTIAARYP